jgi:hypothetical protein
VSGKDFLTGIGSRLGRPSNIRDGSKPMCFPVLLLFRFTLSILSVGEWVLWDVAVVTSAVACISTSA